MSGSERDREIERIREREAGAESKRERGEPSTSIYLIDIIYFF
jgi:hypothetical protein